MTYQDTISPAQVLSEDITATRKAWGAVTGFFAAVQQSIVQGAMARARIETIRAMQGMSDGQLATLDLKREDIVPYVMGNIADS